MNTKHSARRSRGLVCESLEPRLLLDGSPLITELMAANHHGLEDIDLDFPDWIEIHNPTAAAIDLSGWYLTDQSDDLTRWQFPSATLVPSVQVEPGGYLVVFASGKQPTYDDAMQELHTDFNSRWNWSADRTPLSILTLHRWQIRGFSLRENALVRGVNGHV